MIAMVAIWGLTVVLVLAGASPAGFLVGARYGLETSWVVARFLAWRLRLARPASFRP